MSSSNKTLSSPDISDVMSLLCAMKKQNEEVLIKLNSIEEENRKLRQELLEIRNSQTHENINNNNNSDIGSRKRDEPEDKEKHQNEQSNSNKRSKVSVDVATVPELPASFDSLDDDCLGNVLEFVGKKCYSAFGCVNKRCHEIFCSKGLQKESFLFGYGPLHLILEKEFYVIPDLSDGVFYYNRRDIIEWLLADRSEESFDKLRYLCENAVKYKRLDILREVFLRANGLQLECLRDCNHHISCGLCYVAARYGNIEYLKFLRERKCGWDQETWIAAKEQGHEHFLQYLRENGYPTKWQVESDSDSD